MCMQNNVYLLLPFPYILAILLLHGRVCLRDFSLVGCFYSEKCSFFNICNFVFLFLWLKCWCFCFIFWICFILALLSSNKLNLIGGIVLLVVVMEYLPFCVVVRNIFFTFGKTQTLLHLRLWLILVYYFLFLFFFTLVTQKLKRIKNES